MTRKVVIDSDSGVTETIAIALAMFDPDIELLAVSAVAGTVDGRQATRNIQAVIEALDPDRHPRVGAAEVDERGQAVAWHGSNRLNGLHGLGDRQLTVAELHHIPESKKLLVDLVRESPDEITLVTLGPLTNVHAACDRLPDFLGLLDRVVCLAGRLDGIGDVSAVAELNLFANPKAGRRVLMGPPNKLIVPRDVAQRFVLSFESLPGLDWLPSPFQRLVDPLLKFSLRSHHHHLGVEGARLEEVVALLAAIQPGAFQTQEMKCDVEVGGELTRGMLVVDDRQDGDGPTNVEVVVDFDEDQLMWWIRRLVRHACR